MLCVNYNHKSAFTLIELIMVIVIVGILAAIAIPKIIGLRVDAQKAACFDTASTIQTALSSYYVRHAMSGNAVFPRTLHDPVFISYILENTLPRHPLGRDWDSGYSTADPIPAGPQSFTFSTGKGSNTGGICTGF